MKFVRAAYRLARTSQHPTYPMACIIFRGGSVLAQATNGPIAGQHAEIRALSADMNFERANLVVVRANGDRTSKPCRACFRLAKSLGIRKLYYCENRHIVNDDARYAKESNYRDYQLPQMM